MNGSLIDYLNLQYTVLLKIHTEYSCSEFDLYHGKDCQVTMWSEAEIPDLPGCKASGTSLKEALDKLREAKEKWLRAHLKRGIRVPKPTTKVKLVVAYFINGECVNVKAEGGDERKGC